MPWVLLYAAVAVAGLAVLATCGARVLAAVRELGREVERTERRLEPGLAALERASDRGSPPRG